MENNKLEIKDNHIMKCDMCDNELVYCDICGKEFEIEEDIFCKNKYHFCSVECIFFGNDIKDGMVVKK